MVTYLSPIDPHVHFRGEEYSDVKPSFLELGFRDACAVGLAAIAEHGNMKPSLTRVGTVEDRKRFVEPFKGNVGHYMHVVMTPDPEQRREAMKLVEEDDRVVSGKTFYVESTATGEIEILDPGQQRAAWFQKAAWKYKGTEGGHFENGSKFVEEFDPNNPISHSHRQCAESEPDMFEMQFRNAYDAGFKGNFVVLHTSNPDTVDLGDSLVKALKPKFGLFYEVSFHHMFLNTDDYEVHGNRVKMNPSLTSPEMQERTLEYVLAGRYHMIGTDHAPHPVGKKDSDKPSSGIPVLPFWPRGLEILAREGMSIDRRDKLSFHNANEIYGLGLTPTEVNIEHQPRLWEAYGWNSFSRYD